MNIALAVDAASAPAATAPLQLGEPRRRALHGYYTLADTLLPLFGRGPVLDLGASEHATLDAWRWHGIDASALDVTRDPDQLTALPYADGAFQAVVALHVLEHLAPASLDAALRELARVTGRYLFVRVATSRLDPDSTVAIEQPRSWWETKLFRAGFGKHPRCQQLTRYAALEDEGPEIVMAFERLPVPGGAEFDLASLADERDLHMDMLRETGRRADAHVARYTLAAEFVRPRDRVLDAACGLGYGAALIHDATRADTVVGIDASDFAVRYAAAIFGARRARVTFTQDDVRAIERLPDGSTDVVISFETLEHIVDPAGFVREAARVLTPGGRFICSIPNRWVDETGRDPNPHHLHVFDVHGLLGLFDAPFHIERLFGQTAGGGMKHYDAPRAMAEVDPLAPVGDPEWWIVVAMKSPLDAGTIPFREPESAHPDAPTWNITAIERDYDNPWLVRALVTRGFRASSPALLGRLAADVARTARRGSPDEGAALCVRAYAELCGDAPPRPDTLASLDAYRGIPAGSPHVERWRISNEYVLARLLLQQGFVRRAEETFASCARRDCLVFGPLLATKTVDAAFWAGWLALQRGDPAEARRDWSRGVEIARAAVAGSWQDVIGRLDAPLLFGLRELAQVLDCASRCASGLHMLAAGADRPDLVASQAFHSMGETMARQARALSARGEEIDALREVERRQHAEIQWRARESRERGAEIDRLRRAAADANRSLQILIQRITDRRGAAVFGAGAGGRGFAARWTGAGGTVACFSDNRAELWGSLVDGIAVIPPADLADRDVALIAIASVPGYRQIAAQLQAMRLPAGVEIVNGAAFGADGEPCR